MSGYGVVTLFDPSGAEEIGGWAARMDSDLFRRWVRAVVLVDGQPIGPLNILGPTSFPVPPGRHVISARFEGRLVAFARREWWFTRPDSWLMRAHARLASMPIVGRGFDDLSDMRKVYDEMTEATRDLEPLHFSIGPGGTAWVATTESEGRLVFELSDAPPADLGPATMSVTEAGPAGEELEAQVDANRSSEVRLTGVYELVLTTVIPIPHVEPGTVVTWTASDADIESTVHSDSGIRADAAVNIGMVQAKLSRQFGASPSREQTNEKLRQLSLPLHGDRSTAWEVRVFDVWQQAELTRGDGTRLSFSFCSGPTASAFPVGDARGDRKG